jgi:FkbM family methyltransferase
MATINYYLEALFLIYIQFVSSSALLDRINVPFSMFDDVSSLFPVLNSSAPDIPLQFMFVKVCTRICRNPFWMAVPSPLFLNRYGYAGGNVQVELGLSGLWDREETLVATQILEAGCHTGKLMVDVGANTGYFSGLALSAGCDVVAFEPTAYHAPFIWTTVGASKRARHFKLIQRVVSDETGVNIPFDTWNVANSAVKKVKTTVVSTRIDDVVSQEVLYLKIDIEGHEPAAFRGLQKLLETNKVRHVTVSRFVTRH